MSSNADTAAPSKTEASVKDMMTQVNKVCSSKGPPYSHYSCREVAWEDAERGTVSGELSAWGPNITDTRLWARDGRSLFTVRTSNFDEKIGRLNASEISVLGTNGRRATLRDVLQNMGDHGAYAGVAAGTNLLDNDLDDEVGVRFQTTFLPVDVDEYDGAGDDDEEEDGVGRRRRGTLEFCSENFNYQTQSEDDPRNLLILATTQGMTVQQDGPGPQRIYHHEPTDGSSPSDGGARTVIVNRHWLEAERTGHSVSGPQDESEEAAAQSEAMAGEAEIAAKEATELADQLRKEAESAASAAAALEQDDEVAGNGKDQVAAAVAEKAREAAENAIADAERSIAEAERASEEARLRRQLHTEVVDAESRGKAKSSPIGTEAMGSRCSAVLTVQVPLEQRRAKEEASIFPPVFDCGFSSCQPPKLAGGSLGISFGATHSCVGVWMDNTDRVEIVANEEGKRTTPSYVAFTESEECLVGDLAKSEAGGNASNTIFNSRGIMGRKFSDSEVQSDMKNWPFTVVPGSGDTPLIQVHQNGEEKFFKAEEISSLVLGKIRGIAEAYLCEEAKNAVIAVPTHFNDVQRQATKAAGKMAGLNVLRIINEPTAAAIAYGLDKHYDEKHVVVFDLGGTTLDVTVLLVEEGIFEVVATSKDVRLGGNDFDERLVRHFLGQIKREHGLDISGNVRSVSRLREACEVAKRTLSSTVEAMFEVEALVPAHPFDGYKNGGEKKLDFHGSITRAKFEVLCMDLFRSAMSCVERALHDAQLTKDEVNEVLVVGGSCHIPKVRDMLSDFFYGRKDLMHMSIDPDEVVARGATAQAAILSGADQSEKLSELLLLDVIPLSLGVAVVHDNALPLPTTGADGTMSADTSCSDAICKRVIERNSTVPVKKTVTLTTSEDDQSYVAIAAFDGERPLTKHNDLMGCFTFGPLPPMPRGTPQIRVTFDVDANGILTVSASCDLLNHGKEQSIAITNDKGRLTQEDIERMVSDADQYSSLDARDVAVGTERWKLREFISSMRTALEETAVRRSLGEDRCMTAEEALDEADDFLRCAMAKGIEWEETSAGAMRDIRERLQSSLEDVRCAADAGESNAARVSRGSVHDTWTGLTVKNLRRAAQRCTVTVTMYNTVRGGVPSAADVCDTIDDLERLYEACDWCGRLSDTGAGIGQATKVQVRRALLALAMASHPRLGAQSPARFLPQDVLLIHIGSFLIPKLGKLKEVTAETLETIRNTILGTDGLGTGVIAPTIEEVD